VLLFFNFTPLKWKIKISWTKNWVPFAFLQELPFGNPDFVAWLVEKLVCFQKFFLRLQVK